MQSPVSYQRDYAPCPVFGSSHGMAAMQLELPFWGRGTLKEALMSYRRVRLPFLAQESIRDYYEKENWLLGVFGEGTQLSTIDLETLERVADTWGPRGRGMMGVTIKKRLSHLRAAMKYAAGRRIIRRDDVPDLPQIPNDSRPGERVLDVAEFQRLHFSLGGRHRDYAALGFWTGHHSLDIWDFAKWMLEPDYQWLDEQGNVIWHGRYWRRNHKNRKCVDLWLPMEPEFRPLAAQMIARLSSPESLVVGHVWGLSKAFAAACDRCDPALTRVRPSRDLRRSFASMLAARGYDAHYIRIAQGHEGTPEFSDEGVFLGASKTTSIDNRHYIRGTQAMFIRAMKKRIAEAKSLL